MFQENKLRAIITTQLSLIVQKKFSIDEVRYISNHIDQLFQETNSNDTQEQKDKRHSRFMKNMILYFIPDDSNYRREQLEKLPYYNEL
jgi:hypothetical protein